MCDPLTIAGIALTAGSTVANTMAQNKAAKARSSAMEAERLRQQGLQHEADALNTVSQDRYGPGFETGREQTAKQLGDVLASQDISAAPGAIAEGPPDTSAVTTQESNKAQAAAKGYTQQQGQARGKLMSFGDYLGDTSRMQARDATQIGQVGGFMRGSSDVLPYELEAAGHKGDALKTFGDILNFGGSLALGKGLQNPDWNPLAPSSAAATTAGTIGPWGAALPPATDPWAGLRTVKTSTAPLRVTGSGRVVRGVGGLYAGSA